MTPNLMRKYINAYNRHLEDIDELNHDLGIYVGLAIKNPKKYPSEPFKKQKLDKINNRMTDDQMKEEAKRIAVMFGGKIN